MTKNNNLPTSNFRYKGVEGGKFVRDDDGRLSGELLNLPKGNCFVFQGYSLEELEGDFKDSVEEWSKNAPRQ